MVLPHFQRPAFFSAMTYMLVTPPTASFSVSHEIQAGAAGQDLHALCFQRLEILQHGRAFTGQRCAAVIEQNSLGQLVLLGQRKYKGLEQGLTQLLAAFAHRGRGNRNHRIGAGIGGAD